MVRLVYLVSSFGDARWLTNEIISMATLPSFEELLTTIPENKQHMLDKKITNEADLAKIASSLDDWQLLSPYLCLTEAEECAILDNHRTVERRR